MLALYRRFARNENGNFAIIMGLALVPIVALAGAAIDYSQLHGTRSKMQSAADAAILAAARDSRSVNEYAALTEAYMAANLPDLDLEIIAKAGPKSVTLQVVNAFEPSFLGLAGINSIPIEVMAEVAIEKFSYGKTAGGNQVGAGAAAGMAGLGSRERREVIAALRELRDQMLKATDRLAPRHQAQMRQRIRARFERLIAEAASGGNNSKPVHLSR